MRANEEMTEVERGGVEAIIELCKRSGETETPERALKNWRAFTPEQRTMTLVAHLGVVLIDALKRVADKDRTNDPRRN